MVLNEDGLGVLMLVLFEILQTGCYIKPLLKVTGVIAAEVVAVVLHAVCFDLPNLILSFFQGCHLGSVYFDQLGSVF